MHEAIRVLDEIRPLRDPLLIGAFSGFTDQPGAATHTIDYLARQWVATPFAEIDAERFYDFTVQRPRVRLEHGERILDWPANKIYLASPPGASRDVLLLSGSEPHLRWRTFCEAIIEVLEATGSTTSVTLGAQPAGVPHTRPLPVSLSASHEDFETLFGLKAPASRYQGQTGIVGVLNLALRAKGWKNASLWAMAPHYLTVGPNPHIATALIRLVDKGLGTSTSVEPLSEEADQFDEQVRQVVAESEEAAAYVRQLEEQYDANRPALPPGSDAGGMTELPPTPEILDDLERFLRDQRKGE
ncbi:MAG: PAC2 family protein [Chloroflexi bacterium]|nr:PAC2 family protein [Chloroflexota bacterium]MDA1241332.1 PAC2 family protein [Chloroflexota bacterium]